MGRLISVRPDVLRGALIKAAKQCAYAERELAWHERLPDANEWRAERDACIFRCEKILAHALAIGVVSEAGALRLASFLYDAVAIERRSLKQKAYPSDPDGHWQRMDALTANVEREWKKDRWRLMAQRATRICRFNRQS